MSSLPVVEPVIKFHMSLNVADLDRSVDFYRLLFSVEPAKRRPDFAKFELDDPAVVFSLVPHSPGAGGLLSHLGLRVGSVEEVRQAQQRLASQGISTQDQNGNVCGYARQDKVWVQDPDGNFWEIYTVEEDVPPALFRRILEGAAARLEQPGGREGPVVWEHFVTQTQTGPIPHSDASVDEVRLTGTFSAALSEEARAFVVGETFRVLKPGGKVVSHGLMADSPLQGGQPKLPSLAAMVSRVPARTEVVQVLRTAGFVQIQAVKLTEKPWFVHNGIGLREVKFVAFKPFSMANQQPRLVLYKGPFAEAVADGGWTFPRGQRVAVPEAIWQQLRLGENADQFLFFEPEAAGVCCG